MYYAKKHIFLTRKEKMDWGSGCVDTNEKKKENGEQRTFIAKILRKSRIRLGSTGNIPYQCFC